VARLYDEILAIARNYMGAAAEDYVRRRIRIVQRGEDPETILPDRLERLAAGIDMTAKMYMGEAKAAQFRDEVLALKERRGPPGSGSPGSG
jgi:hypothetical protein